MLPGQDGERPLFGPDVLLVRIGMDGEVDRQWLPAAAAVAMCGYHEDNGVKWSRAWILADEDAVDGQNMGLWDRSM